MHEHCGLVAVYSPDFSVQLPLALTALRGVQHRGQHGAGVSMYTHQGIKTYKKPGLIKQVFSNETVERLITPSKWSLLHCRYGTYGDYDDLNLQPLIGTNSHGEQVAVIHNGQFAETPDWQYKQMEQQLPGSNDSYWFTQKLITCPGNNWEEKILNTLDTVTGAYCVAIGVGNRVYLARDPNGIRPLVLGKKDDAWVAVSETFGLHKIGAKVERQIKPGEVVRMDENGLTTIREGHHNNVHFCDFEWAYFSRPESRWLAQEKDQQNHQLRSFAGFRYRCGKILAKESSIPNATFVTGLPDSGIHVASGYAAESGLTYRPVIIRDHFDSNGESRLFMRDEDKSGIKKKILGKLSLITDPEIWKDAVVVLGDDSIVRSNVSTQVTEAIFSLGAKEIHWIVGFPPVKAPCHLGVSMRTKDELIAVQQASDPQKIAKAIGATSVHYISPQGFIEARVGKENILVPPDEKDIYLANGGCGGCLTGRYPVTADGKQYNKKFKLFAKRSALPTLCKKNCTNS